jgi:hypothetical protein
VDDAKRSETPAVRFEERFLNHCLHVSRRERVKVEDVGNGNLKGFHLL